MNVDHALAEVALQWMMEAAKVQKLPLREGWQLSPEVRDVHDVACWCPPSCNESAESLGA